LHVGGGALAVCVEVTGPAVTASENSPPA
jgi:hypothetical protein